MARIRNIKPEFFQHETLFELEKETGLPVRVAFVGLWTCCDREGRFKWRPRQLKTQILPYDDLDFSRVLDALVTRGLLVRYACGTGERREEYGCIPSWRRNQYVNAREAASELPAPPPELEMDEQSQPVQQDGREWHGLNTREVRVADACARVAEVEVEVEVEGKSRRVTNASRANATASAPLVKFPTKPLDSDCTELAEKLVKQLKYELSYPVPGFDGHVTVAASAIRRYYQELKCTPFEAADRIKQAQEIFVASPLGMAAVKPARFWYEEGHFKDAFEDQGKGKLIRKPKEWQQGSSGSNGKAAEPDDAYTEMQKSISIYSHNAKYADLFRDQLKPEPNGPRIIPQTEADKRVSGRSLFEFCQWIKWGEVRMLDPELEKKS